MHLQSKNGLPRHRVVQLKVKIGESSTFDNTFFNKSHWRNILQKNQLLFRVDFHPIPSPLAYEEGWVPKLAAEGIAWFKIFQKVAHYPYSTPAGTIDTSRIYGAFKEVAKTGKYCSVHPFDRSRP